MYETLSTDVKGSFATAVETLRKRLQPPKRDALRSAQLIKRKQQCNELVNKYAQDFKTLFDKSYSQRDEMNQASKHMLKRDIFVQGLLWKWQEKVLPSANTFDDALYQARIAEEQKRQLSDLHRRDQSSGKQFTPPPKKPPSPLAEDKVGDHSGTSSKPGGAQQPGGDARPQQKPFKSWKCRKCFGIGHNMRDCPQRDPPTESPAHVSTSMMTASRPALDQTEESLEQHCQCLSKELAEAELQCMTSAYNDHIDVDVVTGDVKAVPSAVGPLYYADVEVAGTSEIYTRHLIISYNHVF